MGQCGRKSLRCKDFYNHTVARLGRLWSTDCGSHGRGPRFDPLCVHHQARKSIGSSLPVTVNQERGKNARRKTQGAQSGRNQNGLDTWPGRGRYTDDKIVKGSYAEPKQWNSRANCRVYFRRGGRPIAPLDGDDYRQHKIDRDPGHKQKEGIKAGECARWIRSKNRCRFQNCGAGRAEGQDGPHTMRATPPSASKHGHHSCEVF
jgi:hypothetical protein